MHPSPNLRAYSVSPLLLLLLLLSGAPLGCEDDLAVTQGTSGDAQTSAEDTQTSAEDAPTSAEDGPAEADAPTQQDAPTQEDTPAEADTPTQADADAPADADADPEPPPLLPIERCNGRADLCDRRVSEVTFPGTHNAMSNEDEGWVAPNQTHGIARQLEDGVRVLLLDVHPWASSIYLCHAYCQLGRRLLRDALGDIERFLRLHPHEVMAIFFEDYVSAEEVAAVFEAAGLSPYVHTQDPNQPWPTLRDMITSQRRLIVMAQDDGPPPDWYHQGWSLVFDTPYTFERVEDLSCARNRGDSGAQLLMVNHWLGAPLPSPELAAAANARDVLLNRALECAATHQQSVNFLAVDFYEVGALFEVVDVLNVPSP
jgi:hypothetical protein